MNNDITARNSRAKLAAGIFVACGIWMIGLGVYFAMLRPAFLPEDFRFTGLSVQAVQAAALGLQRWLRLVFAVTGGFMAGTGVLTVFVARTAVRDRSKGAGRAMLLSGLPTVVLMSAVNFALGSDFRWLLLAPALLWAAAVLLYALDRPRHGA